MKKLFLTLILTLVFFLSASILSQNSFAKSSAAVVASESSDFIKFVRMVENGRNYICIFIGDVLCSKIEDI